jgi:putative oxidoreductase
MPLPAPLSYAGAVAVEIVCSVMLIVGYRTRAAAAVLALYCVATAVFFHSNFADTDNIIHLLKNVAMTGGLLQIVGFGAGALSIDNRHQVRKRCGDAKFALEGVAGHDRRRSPNTQSSQAQASI